MLFVSDREVALAIEFLDLELDPQQLEHPARRESDLMAMSVRSRARLVHTNNSEFVEEVPLDRHRILLGRDLGNDVVISSPSASRYHAVIFSDAHGLLLVDLHSTNGPAVNGKSVTKHRLRRNDVITVGQNRLSIKLDNVTYQGVVTMDVQDAVHFPKDTSAKILTSGLLGDQYIGLEPGPSEELLADGQMITQTQSAVVLENLIGQFLSRTAAEAGSAGGLSK